MAKTFYQSSWGTITVWFAEVSSQGGRTLVIHPLTSGENFPVQDRGPRLKVTRGEMLFDEIASEDIEPIDRFHAFEELVNRGEPQIFTHPLRGSYLARIGEFEHKIDDNGTITATAEIVPVEPVRAVSPAGIGTSPVAGDGAVAAAADEMARQLSAVEMISAMPTAALDALDRWATATTAPTRQVLTDVGAIGDMVGQEIDRLGLIEDLALWSTYRSAVMLGDAIHDAGDAATSEVSALFSLRVEGVISLRALVAGIYGGVDAQRYYDIARSLNDIPTPAWIPSGTQLRLPQRPAESRRG